MTDDEMFRAKLSIGAEAICTGLECSAVVLVAIRDGMAHPVVALDPGGLTGRAGMRIALTTALGALRISLVAADALTQPDSE
jgi:hypothetical protein